MQRSEHPNVRKLACDTALLYKISQVRHECAIHFSNPLAFNKWKLLAIIRRVKQAAKRIAQKAQFNEQIVSAFSL